MTRSEYFFVCLVVLMPIACAYATYRLGYSTGYYEKESELKECAAEISNKCPGVTSYAIELENENAKLNKMCRARRSK